MKNDYFSGLGRREEEGGQSGLKNVVAKERRGEDGVGSSCHVEVEFESSLL